MLRTANMLNSLLGLGKRDAQDRAACLDFEKKRKGRKEAIGLWKASQPVPTQKGPAAKLEPSHSHDPLKLHLFSGTRGHIPFIRRKKKEGELHSNSRIKITGQASLNGNIQKPEA
jgi:hypothetical protein